MKRFFLCFLSAIMVLSLGSCDKRKKMDDKKDKKENNCKNNHCKKCW